jgi:hypothetical protein
LNYPARISTLAAAGLPMIQYDNTGHTVATQTLAERENISVFYRTIQELGLKLRQRDQLQIIQNRVWDTRHQFTFDAHVDTLVQFFRRMIEVREGRRPSPTPAENHFSIR